MTSTTCWLVILVVFSTIARSPTVPAQRSDTCSTFGAVSRGGQCIYPALADCRRKPADSSQATKFQCPTNTTCEPFTGLCVCVGDYRDTNDRDNILTCIRGQARGKPCSDSDPCLPQFRCSSAGICDCSTPEGWNAEENQCYDDQVCNSKRRGTFFETESRSCKCLIGNTDCRPRSSENCPLNGHREETREFSPQLIFQTTMRCECDSGFTKTEDNKRCVLPRNFGESCNVANGEICDRTLDLTCISGTCGCNRETKLWNPATGSCQLQVWQACDWGPYRISGQGKCGPNMMCTRDGSSGLQCTCNEGYYAMGDGRCAGLHNTACSTANDCTDGLDCMEGVCDCRDRLNKVYDPSSPVMEPCRVSIWSQCSGESCVTHAHCNTARGVCECDDEYKEDSQVIGHCVAAFSHGAPCNATQCDSDKAYACKSGRCECLDSAMVYSGAQQGCLAKVGSKCGQVGLYTIACESSAKCDPILVSSAVPRKFTCVTK